MTKSRAIKIDGYGSITPIEDKENRLCRKWRIRPKSFIDPRTGDRVFPEETFNGTYSQAVGYLKRCDEPTKLVSNKKLKTIEDVGKAWLLEQRMNCSKAERTLEKYHTHLNILYHHLGHAKARSVNSKHIKQMIYDCKKGDSPSGKPLSGTYLRSVLFTLNKMFKWALKEGYVQVNPIEDVDSPKVDSKERRSLKRDQIVELKNKLDPENVADVVCALALEAGYRRSEIAFSYWRYIDLIEGEALVAGTKTPDSFALTALSPFLVEFLLKWKEHQRKYLASLWIEQTEDTPVVCTVFGEPFAPNSLNRLWRARREDLGLPDFGLHELRHTFCTTLARNKTNPKLMQELMRHADSRMATEIYTHVDIEDMKEAIGNLGY